jgi:hypothetical protein
MKRKTPFSTLSSTKRVTGWGFTEPKIQRGVNSNNKNVGQVDFISTSWAGDTNGWRLLVSCQKPVERFLDTQFQLMGPIPDYDV